MGWRWMTLRGHILRVPGHTRAGVDRVALQGRLASAAGERRCMRGHPSRTRGVFLDIVLGASALLSALGLAGLFAAIGLGFEEPNAVLFVASACLLPAAPLAVILHAALTSRLTPARRRTWLRAL